MSFLIEFGAKCKKILNEKEDLYPDKTKLRKTVGHKPQFKHLSTNLLD